MQYSNELREAVLKRLLPPNSEPFSKVAAEEGISEQTLRNWFNKAKSQGLTSDDFNVPADKWSTQDKFLIVVETAGMSEADLAEYARKKSLYVDQIKSWRDACMSDIVGWEVWPEESAEHAAELIERTSVGQRRLTTTPLVLHSDNGSPMKGATMLEKLYQSAGTAAIPATGPLRMSCT